MEGTGMSWRDVIKVSVSNAELQIAEALGENEEYSWISQKPFCLLFTMPDFYFADINLAVYIDGEQVHKHEKKDEELRRLLTKRHGCKILVYRYHAPLTKTRKAEIVADILDNVKGYRRNKI